MPSLSFPFSVVPRALVKEFDGACSRLDSATFGSALWNRRLDVWNTDSKTRQLIANRLGWLQATDFVAPLVPRLRAFAESVTQSGFTDIVLLGMGGSSLAPEVLRQVLCPPGRQPRFRVLDSVDPDAVRGAMAQARDTLFILASKSGTTIEPNVMAEEAKRRVIADGHANWGSRFVAITDPDTALHRRAVAEGFRDVFVNPADIGGRYSALSLFGMVPAALMGLDLEKLLSGARAMEEACRIERTADNPGLALGALMSAGAHAGRDKLTLWVAPQLQSFGLWVEQLVAESTGKHGKGVVPVTGEPDDLRLGSDRVVVALSAGEFKAPGLSRLQSEDIPHAVLEIPDAATLGAEFLRWEVATAAAGWLLDINPFDEPNVQQAKDATRVLLDHYRQQRQLPYPEPHGSSNGARLTLTEPATAALGGEPADSFLRLVQPADYVALLAYVPSDDPNWENALQSLRLAIAARTGTATTVGFGPRYLHSTGQLHKGGAPSGVFIIITADPKDDLPIPGEPYSFGVLEMAQALGDFQSLERTGRRALFVRFPQRDVAQFRQFASRCVEAGL
jgi:transaldolase/glucose-6-phosphate isomerase